MKLILASSSPRRIDIMNIMSNNYTVMPSNIEDSLILSSTVRINTMVSAFMKAQDVFEQAIAKNIAPNNELVVIGADTVVSIGDFQFGKPKNENDSFKMLKSLSGKSHEVTTGYAIISSNSKYVDCVSTKVEFKALDDDTIKKYIESKEGIDKAGSYAIQGLGSVLVKKIEGDYDNVVGLPISAIYDKLKEKFKIDLLSAEV
ncbi:septum formation protein Maf [Criibacterium bergeronii]|uniref:dTTP/UTP pyrophosphatase n=1 Tax=Criibacterium bergeronii TaxID=1871336 RepID=A0A552VBB2_9FIRM|nr:Maf family protein [Criibacterium bergeronii]TRW27762.1 septum formation protein Maf [Criibacterium bergeronii]